MLIRRTRSKLSSLPRGELRTLIAACLFWAWTGSATGADSPSISDNDLYENYRRICGQHQADRQMSAMLGCIVLSQDPEGTKQEIRFVAQDLCGKLQQTCSGSVAQRGRLLPVAEAMACGASAAACGGTGGRALARNYELCGGRLSLTRFLVGGNRMVMWFSYPDGSRSVFNENRHDLFPPPAVPELGGRLVDSNSDLAYTIDEMEVLVRQFANEHCEFFFQTSGEPSLTNAIIRVFSPWLRSPPVVRKVCDPADAICIESQKAIRRRSGGSGIRG